MVTNIVPFAEKVCQKKLGVQHVLVIRHGKMEASFHFQPTDRRSDIHSATKSVVSLAVGIALNENLFTLDSSPADVLKKYLPEDYAKAWENVKVRDLLKMASGHDHKLLDGYSLIPGTVNRDDLKDPEWVHYIFSQPLQLKPGSRFVYNNSCPHLLSRMISEITDMHLIDWLRPRLFTPLEINNPQWYTDPLGYTCGPGGLQVTTEEFSRLGLLCLQGGRWNSKQLIPESYIQEATSFQIATCTDETRKNTSDSTSGYGYFFWRTKRNNGYYFSGWGGQLCIILPDYDAVICMKSYEFNEQALMDTVWETIVSQW